MYNRNNNTHTTEHSSETDPNDQGALLTQPLPNAPSYQYYVPPANYSTFSPYAGLVQHPPSEIAHQNMLRPTFPSYGAPMHPPPPGIPNQNMLRPPFFQPSAPVMTNPLIYGQYANSLQNMAGTQIPQHFVGMARPLPLPYAEGITTLSPVALPFQPVGGGLGFSPRSQSFQPSHMMPVNSSPSGQPRSYSTRNSPSPPGSSPLPKKGRSSRSPSSQFRKVSRGQPEPTQEYLAQSQLPIQSSKIKKPLLLVIDLNGTILYRPSKRDRAKFDERPFTQSFLTYAFGEHKVMIWSSAKGENVQNMCAKLFPGKKRDDVVAEWSREHLDLTKQEYNSKTQVYKRLERVWADPQIQATYPKRNQKQESSGSDSQKWDQSNTVLIDDTLEKARGQPYNLIELPEFTGKNIHSDTVLPVLIDYLEILRKQEDVSAYIRTNPFDYTTLKAKFSAVDQNDEVFSEDSYNAESYDPTSNIKDVDVGSNASDESYNPAVDPTSKDEDIKSDIAACSDDSDGSYNRMSLETEEAVNRNKGTQNSSQLAKTAVNNERDIDSVLRRMSETSLKENRVTMKLPAPFLAMDSDDSDSEDGGVRLPVDSIDEPVDSEHVSIYRVSSQRGREGGRT